jgi:hypothetical protein
MGYSAHGGVPVKPFCIGFALGGSIAAAIDSGFAWVVPVAVCSIVFVSVVVWVGVSMASAAVEIPEGDK